MFTKECYHGWTYVAFRLSNIEYKSLVGQSTTATRDTAGV